MFVNMIKNKIERLDENVDGIRETEDEEHRTISFNSRSHEFFTIHSRIVR